MTEVLKMGKVGSGTGRGSLGLHDSQVRLGLDDTQVRLGLDGTQVGLGFEHTPLMPKEVLWGSWSAGAREPWTGGRGSRL